MSQYLIIELETFKTGKTGTLAEKYLNMAIPQFATIDLQLPDKTKIYKPKDSFTLNSKWTKIKEYDDKALWIIVIEFPTNMSFKDYNQGTFDSRFQAYCINYIQFYASSIRTKKLIKTKIEGSKKTLIDFYLEKLKIFYDEELQPSTENLLNETDKLARKIITYGGLGFLIFTGFKIVLNNDLKFKK